jgi:hypothetical protein
MNYNQIPASDEDAQIQKAYRQRPELLAITSEQRGPVLPHFRCSLETVKGRRYVERAGVAPINLQTAEMEIRDRTNAYLLCQEYWGTATYIVSSRYTWTKTLSQGRENRSRSATDRYS